MTDLVTLFTGGHGVRAKSKNYFVVVLVGFSVFLKKKDIEKSYRAVHVAMVSRRPCPVADNQLIHIWDDFEGLT